MWNGDEAKRRSATSGKIKSVLTGVVGLSIWVLLLYVIFVSQGMEKPSFVPLSAHSAAEILGACAGVAIFLCYAVWLLGKTARAFRKYPGWCCAAIAVWGAIYYCYAESELTRSGLGRVLFVIVGGLVFVLLASALIRDVEQRTKQKGAREER
jgi:hypothetical protein